MKTIDQYLTFESFENDALTYDIRKEWTLGSYEPNDNELFGFISSAAPATIKENSPKLDIGKAWKYSEYDDQGVKELNFKYLYQYLKEL